MGGQRQHMTEVLVGADHDHAAGRPDALLSHGWPGNVRELRNRVERASAMADGPAINADDLFPEARLARPSSHAVPEGETLDEIAQEAIRARIRQALADSGGNQAEAARRLGVSRTTVWKYSR